MMTNKKIIFKTIKEELKTNDEIAWGYAQLVPCDRCVFKKECRKDKESVGSSKCAVILNNKLQEDKEKMESKEEALNEEVKEDEEKTEELVKEIPTNEWYEKELFELRAKITELEFEKEWLLLQVMKLSNNDPKNCY